MSDDAPDYDDCIYHIKRAYVAALRANDEHSANIIGDAAIKLAREEQS